MGRLIKDTELTFYRPPTQAIGPSGRLINPNPNDLVEIVSYGSLQPYRRGKETDVLPEGIKTIDARFWYSAQILQTADQNNDIQADFTYIDGKKFIVFDNGDQSVTNVLKRLAHFEYILIKDETEVQP